MRVLIVCTYRPLAPYDVSPFVSEQVAALRDEGVEVRYYKVKRKGVGGYLRELPGLRKAIKKFHPQLIHAHYGLCGLLANLQRRVPVVTTYHGSDVNVPRVRRFSKIAVRLSAYNIFVSAKLQQTVRGNGPNGAVIPCGIDLTLFQAYDRDEACRKMGLSPNGAYVLFAGSFGNAVKDSTLAMAGMKVLEHSGVRGELLELKGYTREQVCWLLSAARVALLTSKTEGSSQFIKEAMACGCPIVSVDVGDIREMTAGVEGCYMATRDPGAIAYGLRQAMDYAGRTKGREKLLALCLDNKAVAQRIVEVYRRVVNPKRDYSNRTIKRG